MAKRKAKSKRARASARPAKQASGKTCASECGWMGWVVLVLGLLFLLRDFGGWAFWGIGPWSVVFTLVGLAGVMKK